MRPHFGYELVVKDLPGWFTFCSARAWQFAHYVLQRIGSHVE